MATQDHSNSPSAPSADLSGSPTPSSPGGADSPSFEAAALRAELLNERLAAAGIGAEYVDLVSPTFSGSPTKEAVAAFADGLRKVKPALFRSTPPAQTAPTPSRSVPSAPAPGASITPFQQWQAIEASGDLAASEAFYRLNHKAINRTAR
jgi:hypothetical protein